MKKRVCAWLLSIAVLFFSCAAVFRVPARAAASGEWVLTEVEDTIPENHTQKSEDPPYSRIYSETFHYAPSEYSVNWVSDTTGYDGKKTHEEGTNSIRFSAMPEQIRPGEAVTITATVSVTSSEAVMDKSEDSFGYTAWAELPQEIPDEAIVEGQHRNEYLVPLFAQNFTSSHKISFSMPEADPGTDSVYFDFGMPMGSEDRTFTTRYTYKWETGAAPTATQTPEAADIIKIKGLVLSAEAKPMRWMELDAQVYYGQDQYDSVKKPDAVIKSATDHEGRYSISIPIRENDTEPVGILLTGTLKCLYPFDGHDVFYFADMQDAYSKDNNRLSVSTWLSVNPKDYPDTAPDDPVSVYRLLAFYNLGLGAWSFDAGLEHLVPDPVYLNSSDPKHPEWLENYSTLYTAAFDAWFFGAAVLGEAEALVSKPLRVEVRWPVDPKIGASHYNPADHCIRLEETDSLRDDNSRFAVLHEFGHAFDLTTNEGIFRAYAEYGLDNQNHGGYMNSTTSDSYIEGFATYFAATVQLYSGYKNPGTLSSLELADPSMYTAWGRNGKNEEFAIATLLYNTQYLVDDIEAYWSILNPDRANFYEYYTAIKTYLEEKSPETAQRLRQFAIDSGLYRMSFEGNGEYDPGEPFRDLAGGIQAQRDANEPYADLMFGTDENGFMDPTKPLQEYDESSLAAGEVSDASRVRKTIEDPPSGFLYLSGETAEYLLVDILPDGEAGSRTLRAVKDGGKVLIGLPDKAMCGTVKVSVPGGNTIYEGDLAVLQRRQAENAGQAVPLAEARIDVADLAKAGIKVAATYGDVNDSGVLSIPDISQNEIVRLSDGYDVDASLDAVTAALVERKGAESDKQSGAGPVLLYIAVGAGLLMIAALVLFAFSGRKRLDVAGLRPSGVCPNCGAALPGGAGFCTVCGEAAAARPKASPVCVGCGASLAHNMAFCSVCGRPAPAAPPEAHVSLQLPNPQLWLIIAISVAGMAALCVGAHFLFFAGGTPAQSVFKSPVTTAVSTVVETVTVQPTSAATGEIVNEKTIKIDIAFDSGEGIYTGEVKDGVPHGQGSFEMKKSDNGKSWSYEGQWRNGDIIGEGVMKQGTYVFSGGFRGGLLNGDCEIKDNGVLRYKGTCKDGKLHGQGTLYTRGGTLLFEGAFGNDMLVESATDREKRGRAFISECDDMDTLMYGVIMDGRDAMDYPVAVWGLPIAMGEQKSTGTIVIGHMGEGDYPVCLLYRYGVDEAKMTKDDWINAWGVVIGTYEYKDEDGLTGTCPLVEVIYWNNEQEGL